MQIQLIVTGKTESLWVQQGTDLYYKRIRHYIPFNVRVIPGLRNAKNLSPAVYKEKEGELLIPVIKEEKDVYLMDEQGREFSSREFAGFVEKKMNSGCRNLIFIIGGPYGFSEEIHRTAAGSISLSRLTFSHQLVRLVFAEQLYRACTIIKGESYHHD